MFNKRVGSNNKEQQQNQRFLNQDLHQQGLNTKGLLPISVELEILIDRLNMISDHDLEPTT